MGQEGEVVGVTRALHATPTPSYPAVWDNLCQALATFSVNKEIDLEWLHALVETVKH